MNRCSVSVFPRTTPQYAVAHAKWRRSRGRNPSEPYGREKNPKKALALALKELSVYVPMAGSLVTDAARHMARTARLTGEPCTAKFNDVQITARPGDTPNSILSYYNEESQRRSALYEASPAGQLAKRKAEERRVALQNKLNQLMKQLPNLDFSNHLVLVNWLNELQEPSDHIGVQCPWLEIIETFAQHGFTYSMNCGVNFDGESESNYAGWLIGQGLDGLASSVHAIHQVYHKFAADWRRKFGHEPNPSASTMQQTA